MSIPWRRLAAIAGVAAVLGLLIALHTPYLNGPWYWTWPWRRLEALSLFSSMALCATPLFVGYALVIRGKLTPPLGLLLAMVSMFALELTILGLQSDPISLTRLGAYVRDPVITSYFTDAERHVADPTLLARFDELLPSFHVHARNKPPFPILFCVALLRLVESPSTASAIVGLLLALFATTGIPATHMLVRVLTNDRKAAFSAAAFYALCAGPVLFVPEFDQMFPLLAAVLVVTWLLALRRRSPAYGVVFGAVLALCLFVSYSLLLFGALLVALAARRDHLRNAMVQALTALATVLAMYGALWAATGFDPLSTFVTAVRNQGTNAQTLGRPYCATVFFDLGDFALGASFVGAILAVAALTRRHRRRHRWAVWLCLGQILMVDLSGLLRCETARVWIFLLPLLLLPAGLELRRYPLGAQLGVLGLGWLLLGLIAQNMTFIRI